MPVLPSRNTNEGYYFVLNGVPSNATISQDLLNAFENGDNRKSNWVTTLTIGSNTYYAPFKYKIKNGAAPLSEYYMVLRLAEVYLIRSEARAHADNLTGAIEDLNAIRLRAGLQPYSGSQDRDAILDAIDKERRIELFAEWGHRWLDLKREGKASPELTLIKPGFNPTDTLYPIPLLQLQNDPYMHQNPGY